MSQKVASYLFINLNQQLGRRGFLHFKVALVWIVFIIPLINNNPKPDCPRAPMSARGQTDQGLKNLMRVLVNRVASVDLILPNLILAELVRSKPTSTYFMARTNPMIKTFSSSLVI